MRRKPLAVLLPSVLSVILAMTATTARAANGGAPEDEEPFDARLAGYNNETGGVGPLNIKPSSSTAGTWVMTVALGILCFGVMCKDGKRTHLD